MIVALTRAVPPTIADCELTHLDRTPIDLALASAEHAAYEDALRRLGARVERVAAAPDLPDSVFVEDAAVVFDEVAVLMRPGARSRRGEVDAVALALAPYRRLQAIDPPGTMDGGDVLQVGRRVFVGVSLRTSADAVVQLRAILAPFGYTVEAVTVDRCLHLKSAVTAVSDDLLVLNPEWIDGRRFGGLEWIEVESGEPAGANVVRVGRAIVCAEAAPATRRRLEARGLTVSPVPAAELARAEGALTCCSLIFSDPERVP